MCATISVAHLIQIDCSLHGFQQRNDELTKKQPPPPPPPPIASTAQVIYENPSMYVCVLMQFNTTEILLTEREVLFRCVQNDEYMKTHESETNANRKTFEKDSFVASSLMRTKHFSSSTDIMEVNSIVAH